MRSKTTPTTGSVMSEDMIPSFYDPAKTIDDYTQEELDLMQKLAATSRDVAGQVEDNDESQTSARSKKRSRHKEDVDGDFNDDESDREESDENGAGAAATGKRGWAYVGEFQSKAMKRGKPARKTSGNSTVNKSGAVTAKKAPKKAQGPSTGNRPSTRGAAKKQEKEKKGKGKEKSKGKRKGNGNNQSFPEYNNVSGEEEMEEKEDQDYDEGEGDGEGEEDEDEDRDSDANAKAGHRRCEACEEDDDVCTVKHTSSPGHPWRQCTNCGPKGIRCSFLSSKKRPRLSGRDVTRIGALEKDNAELRKEMQRMRKTLFKPLEEVKTALLTFAQFYIDVNEAGPSDAPVPPPSELVDLIGRVVTPHTKPFKTAPKPTPKTVPDRSTTPDSAADPPPASGSDSTPPTTPTMGKETLQSVAAVPTDSNSPDVVKDVPDVSMSSITSEVVAKDIRDTSTPPNTGTPPKDAQAVQPLEQLASLKPANDPHDDDDMDMSEDANAIVKDNTIQ